MKKLIIPAFALALAFGTSAFTAKRTTSNFFKYNGPSARLQGDIQDINNYTALDAEPCSDDVNVCGVTLATPKNVGQIPASGEFSAKSSALWSSQVAHAATDDAIGMEE